MAQTAAQQRLDELQTELNDLRERNLALADAVVNSAEIINELEETKGELAQAKQGESEAHRSTQRLAETIFEGTNDAMLVLDRDYKLLSANRNARFIFELGSATIGQNVYRHLELLYQSDEIDGWFKEMVSHSCVHDRRVELYKCGSDPTEKQWIELSVSALSKRDLDGARFLITAHDVTQRRRMEKHFQFQAFHDNVTRLPNRRFFVQKIEDLISEPEAFAICFFDLDHFKNVNDTLGHDAGDQLLVKVAERIKATTRNDCLLARFGGDEFALLCPGLSLAEVTAIANRIVAELNRPFIINDNSVYVGASIGMTRFPDDAQDVEELLQNADVAMYSAKEGGRNCFHQFSPALAKRLQDRQALIADLRDTLSRGKIDLEYQPKWCLKENRLAGCEALLRWKRNGISIPPADVIDAAEGTGLILPLGYLILETALKQMVHWKEEKQLAGRIAINISPQQLLESDFVARFQRIAEEAGIRPEFVELEITETAMMKNYALASQKLRELQKLGVSIAIDDFGTGYSSLSYLKSFPFSTLKIDKSFVDDLPSDTKAVAVARAILSLAHGLELSVVAEGVETEEQFQFLQEAKCDQIQGYWIKRPLNPRDFEDWMDGLKT